MKEKNFRSNYIKEIYEKSLEKTRINKNDKIKDTTAINFMEILQYVMTASKTEVLNVCADLKKLNIVMTSESINAIIKNKDNENLKMVLSRTSANIDLDSIKELNSKDFNELNQTGCNIQKIYVNSGYDEAAKRGYSKDVYNTIIGKSEKIISKVNTEIPKNATKEQKFMAIYKKVLKMSTFDKVAAKDKYSSKRYTSRNLEGFFCNDGHAVCAGFAVALKQLCELEGLEVEYVQGNSKSKHMSNQEYHAWIKVKLDDGKWYNADPTWDANKVGKPFEFCLKSDKDFYGHNEDRSYTPTYSRSGEQDRYEGLAEYHHAESSYDSGELKSRYYDNDLAECLKNRDSKDYLDSVNRGYGSANVPTNIWDFIIRIINKITGFFTNKNNSQALLNDKNKNAIRKIDFSSQDNMEEGLKKQIEKGDLEGIKLSPDKSKYSIGTTDEAIEKEDEEQSR